MRLPPDFTRRIVEVFGEDGSAWLERLPQVIDEYRERWDIDVGPEFPLSCNYVAQATRRDGSPVVLRAGVPRAEFGCEIAALQHWDGDGAVRLLEADRSDGIVLLERVVPGTPLLRMDDDEQATRIAAGVMRRLHRPDAPQDAFPTLADWGQAFALLRARHGGTSGPLDPALFARGEALFGELVASQDQPIVLHGDLHHENVLASTRDGWLAIDPHGVLGEPAFEVGAWMHNPVGDGSGPEGERALLAQPDIPRVLRRRLDIFAEALSLDRERLRLWSIAFCVLSAAWSDESGHTNSANQAMTVAAHLTAV